MDCCALSPRNAHTVSDLSTERERERLRGSPTELIGLSPCSITSLLDVGDLGWRDLLGRMSTMGSKRRNVTGIILLDET